MSDQEKAVMDQLERALRRGDDMAESVSTLKTITGNPGLVDKVAARHLEIASKTTHRPRPCHRRDRRAGRPGIRDPTTTSTSSGRASNGRSKTTQVGSTLSPSIDDSSTDVVSLLADPHSE